MSEEKEVKKSQTAMSEEEVLKFWEENQIFQKSIENRKDAKEFTFYDGPPFATGLPHYGHLLAGTIKDVIPRYKTMRGFRVSRNWGWDTHGLPIENLIEKELNLNSKAEIEEYGIDKFNQAAKNSVLRYDQEWKKIVPRTGRWVDMENPYITYMPEYTESLWWAFKELNKKGLVKKDFKPMHICPRCETTLSNNEVSEGYKDLKDLSLTAKFELVDEPGTYVLAWTTTPWTLPGNVALAVGPDIRYLKVEADDGERFIFATELSGKILEQYKDSSWKVLEEFKGSDLVGKAYKPLFDYYQNSNLEGIENAWKIYPADFVTTETGTGIVHIAPAFGEDDLYLGKENNLPFIQHVSMNGEFKPEVKDFAGMKVRKLENHSESDVEIIKYLAGKNLLFSKEKIEHSYPTCWRCKTPLLNYATSSWFIESPKIKDKLIAENKKINWVPEHMGTKRFHNWLEGTRDWAVSRSRYWGAPLPIWENQTTGEYEFVGSLEELREKTRSKNKFVFIRHGESESNIKDLISSTKGQNGDKLTVEGKKQAENSVEEILKIFKEKSGDKKLDKIYTSPFDRTKESAKIIQEKLKNDFGIEVEIVEDERLRERSFAPHEGQTYESYFKSRGVEYGHDYLNDKSEEGESKLEVRKRVMDFIYEIDQKHQGENILIVSHGDPIFMAFTGLRGLNDKKVAELRKEFYLKNAKPEFYDFAPIPHDENYFLDFHRPYIDEISWKNEKGEEYKHIKEVFDCWFESGSMPFASTHYPFENLDKRNPEKGIQFPADFIAEGQDQTRGWFNTLLILSTALFGKTAYKNVIVNGIVLAEDGKKMSKSLKNYPPVEDILNKYGADAMRLYLMGSPAVRAESLNFSEKGVDEVLKKIIIKTKNIFSFYDIYSKDLDLSYNPRKSKSLLDKWIIDKLESLNQVVTESLDKYEIDKAVKPFFDFVEDFSTWYIRRSRDRFKSDDEEDKKYALITTNYVLREFLKIMAPFAPFFTEDLWQKLKREGDKESVHLEDWTVMNDGIFERVLSHFDTLSSDMDLVREMVTLGLDARVSAGIKVRQPLRKITFIGDRFKNIDKSEELKEILLDELNIKEIEIQKGEKEKVELDTELDDELRKEGNYREFLRLVQSMRKKAGMSVEEEAELKIDIPEDKRDFIDDNLENLKKVAGIKNINYSSIEGDEDLQKVNDIEFKIVLIK